MFFVFVLIVFDGIGGASRLQLRIPQGKLGTVPSLQYLVLRMALIIVLFARFRIPRQSFSTGGAYSVVGWLVSGGLFQVLMSSYSGALFRSHVLMGLVSAVGNVFHAARRRGRALEAVSALQVLGRPCLCVLLTIFPFPCARLGLLLTCICS